MEKIKADIITLLVDALGPNKIKQKQIVQLLSCLYSFIDNLKQHLELFPENKFSIEEMANAAFTSKYHFIRSFKQKVGLTPHQFQLQNRIRKAQRMINKSDTLTEVALTTGFCDQSHFIKQFEKYVGLTPTTYKMSCSVFNPDFTV